MGTLEVVLLAIAISLDVFVVMTIQGAMLPSIDYKDLVKIGIFFGSWQTVTVGLSNALTHRLILLGGLEYQATVRNILLIIAIVIFTFLGLFMIWKYIRNDTILEQRMDQLSMRKIIPIAMITSIDAFLVGIGLRAVNISTVELILPFIIFSIVAVFAGIYFGHWFGIEEKPVAHYVSGTIFIVISIDLLLHLINM